MHACTYIGCYVIVASASLVHVAVVSLTNHIHKAIGNLMWARSILNIPNSRDNYYVVRPQFCQFAA